MEYTELYYTIEIYEMNIFIILLLITGIFTCLIYLLNKWWNR